MNYFFLFVLGLLPSVACFRFSKALYNVKKKSLLNFIERVYKNSEIFPGSSLVQYPKQINTLDTPSTNCESKWYTIGKSNDFVFGTSKKITIENQSFVVWKKDINEFVGLSELLTL